MTPVVNAALRSWSIPFAPLFLLIVCGLTYLRGWWLLSRAGFRLIPPWRAGAFVAGICALFTALASPMDVFNSFLLTAHMVQHMTLMMVAPPLLLLGNPLLPILRGMPRFAAREYGGPLLRWPPSQRAGGILIHPVTALLLMNIVNFAWHTPQLYDLALRSDDWHQTEHACFFIAALVFWWPVVQPWPSRSYWPRWAMVPYLVIADLQNTTLSAILVFSDRLLYPWYRQAPDIFGLTPQQDQAAAGAIMWVVGSLAYIIPAVAIAVQCLTRRTASTGLARHSNVAEHLRTANAPSASDKRDSRYWTLSSPQAQAISFAVLFFGIGLVWAWLAANSPNEDLQLRAHERSSRFEIYVYGPGDVISAGNVPIGVLVQDAQTRAALGDTDVELSVTEEPQSVHAYLNQSENKLLHCATLEVPGSGASDLYISVRLLPVEEMFVVPFTAAGEQPDEAVRWPYYVFSGATLSLVLIYLWRHRRRSQSQS